MWNWVNCMIHIWTPTFWPRCQGGYRRRESTTSIDHMTILSSWGGKFFILLQVLTIRLFVSFRGSALLSWGGHFHPVLGLELSIFLNFFLLFSNYNKDTNRRGRGRAPKRGRKDLGIITHIQEIVSRVESGASLRVVVRVRSHTRSRGQLVS